MSLAVHKDDADILLKQKNVLDGSILNKYRVSGQIAQTGMQYVVSLINDSYHLGKTEKPYSCQELCIMGDSLLRKLLAGVYNNDVREKGISTPVSIELNEITSGFSPEVDDDTSFYFSVGDIVSITLGVHIDGYTANISHTLVIYPKGEESGNKPGPLLGSKADAICAAHIATEAVVSLIALVLSPEKIPQSLRMGNAITGKVIRLVVDSIAQSFNCRVIPGSKVRRIRRFLAGQAEGIVAERDFKGVVWDESDQEETLIREANHFASTDLIVNEVSQNSEKLKGLSAFPTDEFSVVPGEVYQIDIRMSSISDFNEVGLITLDEIDHFTGKNNRENELNTKPTIFVRDLAVIHQLKLKASRKLLGNIDKNYPVYPFKLSHTALEFPLDLSKDLSEQIEDTRKSMRSHRLGLAELSNRHLVRSRPIQIAKFIDMERILKASNTTGLLGIDANKPVLPGMEIPLPNLGISSLQLKSLMKYASPIAVAHETSCVVVDNLNDELVRLTGGTSSTTPSWVHSDFSLSGPYAEQIKQIIQLASDDRFGIKVRTSKPFKLQALLSTTDSMLID